MNKKRVNKYPKAFRQMAVERMRNCDNVSELAKELGVDRSALYHWRNLTPAARLLVRQCVSPGCHNKLIPQELLPPWRKEKTCGMHGASGVFP